MQVLKRFVGGLVEITLPAFPVFGEILILLLYLLSHLTNCSFIFLQTYVEVLNVIFTSLDSL